MSNACRFLSAVAALSLAVFASSAAAQDGATAQKHQRAVALGIDFLLSKQDDDGAIYPQAGPAVTALGVTAMLRHGRGINDPAVAKGLKSLESFVHSDGGIYKTDSKYRNYETCLAILCLKEANRDGRYDKLIKGADKFIRGEQWDEGEGKDITDPYYGGAGYGSKSRPDMSNTQYLIEALVATGAGPDDPDLKKALVFVSRCQNLETEHNNLPFVAKNPDGGFIYSAADQSSQAGQTDNGGLRSYASMTYAGLKSMIYAGVKADDPRVKAATEWIQKNYDLKSNPGLGTAGLYYYYHTFAKALEAAGYDKFKDADGKEHDWRAELIEELASRQREDGSWVNDNNRWLEGEAELVTSYALLALSHCKKK
jgi:squalene-hopene/tetraprenyl-beta-curcumene cyclase